MSYPQVTGPGHFLSQSVHGAGHFLETWTLLDTLFRKVSSLKTALSQRKYPPLDTLDTFF